MDKHEALDWFLRRRSMQLADKCQAAENVAIECIMQTMGDGWISVKDRLPDSKGQYLVAAIEAGHYRHITIVSFTDHFVMNGHRAYWRVTHWMALPELPKEG